METNYLFQAIIYLSAAIFFVPIAKKIGLSSILGYLLAGIMIGPFVFGLIGQQGQDIMHFAELGVVMMLFLIGLELEPDQLSRMRKTILGMGSLHLISTTSVLFTGGLLLMNWDWKTSLVIALALALSSSAIGLQTLKEKGLTNTQMGHSSFAVLLFQDIAAIPILALLPLLATRIPKETNELYQSSISGFPTWLQILIVIASILAIYYSGRFLFVYIFKIIARTHLQELFTASALLLIASVSCLMHLIGLSPALGAFVAGVVLANSEFSHELKGDIAPFKGLLLGLFFIGVGASINFKLIIEHAFFIFVFGAILTLTKFLISYAVGKIYKNKTDQNLLFALGLSQAGEFGFVIISFCMELAIIPSVLANQMMAVIAMSMVSTPFLQILNERLRPFQSGIKAEFMLKEIDSMEEHNSIIIAGFGHFGSTVGRLLRANNIKTTILDNNPEQIDSLCKIGFKAHYGDATRLEVLEAAGCANAKIFIVAIDDPKVNLQLIKTLHLHFPNLKILTRARNRIDAYELLEHKVDHIYRETLHSAVDMGVAVLVELGQRKYTATRHGQKFIKQDEETTRKLAKKRANKKAFVTILKEEIKLQEQLLKNDLKSQDAATNYSWDSNILMKKMKE